jgi:hypothetical protein
VCSRSPTRSAELLDVGARGMNRPAEIEFAVRLSRDAAAPHEFAFLQMRPLVLSREIEELDVDETSREVLLCRSTQVMGNGRIDDVTDLVVVDFTASIARRAGPRRRRWRDSTRGSSPRVGRTCSSAWAAGARPIRGSAFR